MFISFSLELREIYGNENVVASDVRFPNKALKNAGPAAYLDVMDLDGIKRIIVEYDITWIFHLGALLSAIGEKNPKLAMDVNIKGSMNIIEAANLYRCRLYIPSTIGAFGPSSPKDMTPDVCIMRPTTMYGVSKVSIELLGEYYHNKFGLDYRALRYPGILSSAALPGGGTTDYAIAIFYGALIDKKYECFLSADTTLPMMYMPDCLKCTIDFMAAPREKLTQCVYNIAAWSFSPKEIGELIKKRIPEFEMLYKPDSRQAIADTWPRTLDDGNARKDWGWKETYSLDGMIDDMLKEIGENIKKGIKP